jgi:quercetin dioxygenase-like cupin family protein
MSDAYDHEDGRNCAAVLEAMLLALRPAELPAAQRERMRARILGRLHEEAPAGTRTVRAGADAWIDLAPGLQVLMLQIDAAPGRQTVLLRMEPGAEIPRHRHTQSEEFIVLRGECCIGTHRLRAGDFHTAGAGSWHERTTTDAGVLVMLRGEYPPPVAA